MGVPETQIRGGVPWLELETGAAADFEFASQRSSALNAARVNLLTSKQKQRDLPTSWLCSISVGYEILSKSDIRAPIRPTLIPFFWSAAVALSLIDLLIPKPTRGIRPTIK